MFTVVPVPLFACLSHKTKLKVRIIKYKGMEMKRETVSLSPLLKADTFPLAFSVDSASNASIFTERTATPLDGHLEEDGFKKKDILKRTMQRAALSHV